jgi:tripartite-type tricarboxylate transporter receptor subunit TctC
MKLRRRNFLHLAAGAAALPASMRIARAQAYPTRPVRIVVGFAAGGGLDVVARLMGQWLSERLGQQFIIENRPGAAGNIGAEAVVRAAPDGYTSPSRTGFRQRHKTGCGLVRIGRPQLNFTSMKPVGFLIRSKSVRRGCA